MTNPRKNVIFKLFIDNLVALQKRRNMNTISQKEAFLREITILEKKIAGLKDKLHRRNMQIKNLKAQKQISDTLHIQGSEKINELREELLRRREIMKNCSKCSWQVD